MKKRLFVDFVDFCYQYSKQFVSSNCAILFHVKLEYLERFVLSCCDINSSMKAKE